MAPATIPVRAVVALVALACALAACRSSSSSPAPLQVAAAADLTLAFEEVGQAFTARTGRPVVFTFGSTGLLARQLAQGAPFVVFAAANVAFVDDVVARGVCDGATRRPYARGRLALWSPAGGVSPPTSLADLASPRFGRIAIGHPEHAPYGMVAKAGLQRAGVWDVVAPRLVHGENIRQTLQFAQSGNADVAIVARSLVVDDHTNPWVTVDAAVHPPLDQALVVCGTRDRADAVAFADFVASAAGQAILARHGFDPPQTGATP